MKKPITQWYELNDAAIMQYVEQIIVKMDEQAALFPNPTPSLADVAHTLAEFRLAATEAAYRDTRLVKIRVAKRKIMENMLRELAKYVDTICQQDETRIIASGFRASKDPSSYAGYVPMATGLRAEVQGLHSRRIKLKTDPWKGARMYRFEYRLKGSQAPWEMQLCSKSTLLLSGLEQFEEYEFRVSYVGIHPEPNFCRPVSSYVV